MKAIILKAFGDTGNFELREVADPVLAAGHILVQIKAVSFNPIDCQMRVGLKESGLLRSSILGRELAGMVVDTGPDAGCIRPGDRVAAYIGSLASNGSYAELIAIPRQLVAKMPAGLSFEQGASLPLVGLTALQCFLRLDISKDEPVFIAGGAGGVGTMLIKLLLAAGRDRIVTTAGNGQSRRHCIGLGLREEDVLDYRAADLLEQARRRAPPGVFPYCIDLVGGRMSEVCAELLEVEGSYADVTHLVSEKAGDLLFAKAATLVNIANYAHALTGNIEDASVYGRHLASLFGMIGDGVISPADVRVVGGFCVDTVAQAHRILEENGAAGSRLVMLNL